MRNGNSYDGTLIAVEGLDGAGKSTVVEAIERWGEQNDVDVRTTSEPTDSYSGHLVNRAVENDEDPLGIGLLFVADRYYHVKRYIEPALEDGAIVVTDRYMDSTIAYQAADIAEQMGYSVEESIRRIESEHEGFIIKPDVTLYLDVSVETALERCGGYEHYEEREQLQCAKDVYDRLYEPCDANIRIIDGEQSRSVVRHTALNSVLTKRRSEIEQFGSGKTYADGVRERDDG